MIYLQPQLVGDQEGVAAAGAVATGGDAGLAGNAGGGGVGVAERDVAALRRGTDCGRGAVCSEAGRQQQPCSDGRGYRRGQGPGREVCAARGGGAR
jgi:hypothetical protein